MLQILCRSVGPVRGRILPLAAVALILPLGGCSSTPNWANPVEWYKGARDAVAGSEKDKKSEKAETAAKTTEVPGKDAPFPNLASVPERPKPPSEAEKQALARRLTADRDNARYTEDAIVQRSEATGAPPPAAQPSASPPEPAREGGTAAEESRDVSDASAPANTSENVSSPSQEPPAAGQTAAAPPPSPPLASEAATASELSAVSPAGGTEEPRSPAVAAAEPAPTTRPPSLPSLNVSPRPAARPMTQRPAPGPRDEPRLGSPVFGAPPADIAAVVDAGGAAAVGSAAAIAWGSPAGRSPGASPPPRPPVTDAIPAVSGEPAALVKFADGSSTLTARNRADLRRVAQTFKRQGGTIRVEGHASSRTQNMDPVRHHMVNFEISLERANAVAQELMRQGVPSEAISVVARSDTNPMYYEVMPAGEAGNRRVEVYIVN